MFFGKGSIKSLQQGFESSSNIFLVLFLFGILCPYVRKPKRLNSSAAEGAVLDHGSQKKTGVGI